MELSFLFSFCCPFQPPPAAPLLWGLHHLEPQQAKETQSSAIIRAVVDVLRSPVAASAASRDQVHKVEDDLLLMTSALLEPSVVLGEEIRAELGALGTLVQVASAGKVTEATVADAHAAVERVVNSVHWQ